MMRAVYALCVTLLVIAAVGELAHDHARCAVETSATCLSCVLTLAAVMLPAVVSFHAPPVPHRFCWADPHFALPSGAPVALPGARGPPAC